MCFGDAPYTTADIRFCATSVQTPSATDLQNFFSSGKKFAYHKWNKPWALKYCITITTDSSGNLTFQGYRYKTGGTVKGTITISDGKATFTKTYDSDNPNYDPSVNPKTFVDDIVKVDATSGIAIGYDPDDRNIVLFVETDSCPQ